MDGSNGGGAWNSLPSIGIHLFLPSASLGSLSGSGSRRPPLPIAAKGELKNLTKFPKFDRSLLFKKGKKVLILSLSVLPFCRSCLPPSIPPSLA